MSEMRQINRLFDEEPFHQEPGFVRWRYVVRAAHHNPNRVLHGGVLSTLLDGAMGHAVWTLTSPDGLVLLNITRESDYFRMAGDYPTQSHFEGIIPTDGIYRIAPSNTAVSQHGQYFTLRVTLGP